MLISLLIPAVNKHPPGRRLQAINNLKQIALALHNYHAAYNQFPDDIRNEMGEPLLSWRVRLLPFLDQQAIYDQYDLTQPWDSEANKDYSSARLSVFQLPSQEGSFEDGMSYTCFFMPVGREESGFPRIMRTEKGVTALEDVTDWKEQTLMVVVAKPEYKIPWAQPGDYQFDPNNPKEGLGEYFSSGYLVSLVDGSVLFVSADISDEELLEMFTINDGRPYPEGWTRRNGK